jgi:hypothetical protein
MRNIQHNKHTINSSEIAAFAMDPETLTSALVEVKSIFKLKSHLIPFNTLKSKGLVISSIALFPRASRATNWTLKTMWPSNFCHLTQFSMLNPGAQ